MKTSKIKREELLKQLLSVLPGLSAQEIIEQSSCFVFLNDKIVTFNGDAACWVPCCLNIRGVIHAKTLLDFLQKRTDNFLRISTDDKKLIIRGRKGRITRITLTRVITLPFNEVQKPKEWFKLPKDFLTAVDRVQQCCSKEEEHLEAFVHITKDRIESIGEHQLGHCKIRIKNLNQGVLLHNESIKHVIPLGMTEFGISRKWFHFRNESGVVLSCLRWPDEENYPDTEKVLKRKKGEPIDLPKGLTNSVETCSVFSRENPDDTDITIRIQNSEMTCEGKGIYGINEESYNVNYSGEDVSFAIPPRLMIDLCKKHTTAWLTSETLTVKEGNFTFITTLRNEE